MNRQQSIQSVLRDELALQTRHCKLLELQQGALLTCDRERFSVLQAEYAAILTQMETQNNRRREILRDEDGSAVTVPMLIEMLPPTKRGTLISLQGKLKQTLERAQNLNLRNQQLIGNELKYFAYTLNLFVEAGRGTESAYSGRFFGQMLLDRRA